MLLPALSRALIGVISQDGGYRGNPIPITMNEISERVRIYKSSQFGKRSSSPVGPFETLRWPRKMSAHRGLMGSPRGRSKPTRLNQCAGNTRTPLCRLLALMRSPRWF
jgi:hypothetical protein